MTFPFGRPVVVMLVCATACAAVVASRQPSRRSGLTAWVSDDLHARAYAGSAATPDLVPTAALDLRLASLFMAGPGGWATGPGGWATGPDLAEVEIGSVGKFFRPPTAAVGFLPLNRYLDAGGWTAKIVPARLAPYAKDGVVFGVPYDLHPCTIIYRRDLYARAGVDLPAAATWTQFQRLALQFQRYWADHGRPRTAIGLSAVGPTQLLLMLEQRHVELVDARLAVHLSDPAVVATVCWYARAAAGRDRIGTDFNPGRGQDARDLSGGDVCAAIAADWSVAEIEARAPELAGELAMMPLPRFDPADARTAGSGGTMVGIPRGCPRPDAAWRVIESVYLGPARRRASAVLPPVPAMWADPAYHLADPFFAGQKVDELYISLAGELPSRHMTPYTGTAQAWLGRTVGRAVGYVRAKGTDDAGLEPRCRQWLEADADTVRRMIRFDQRGAATGTAAEAP